MPCLRNALWLLFLWAASAAACAQVSERVEVSGAVRQAVTLDAALQAWATPQTAPWPGNPKGRHAFATLQIV